MNVSVPAVLDNHKQLTYNIEKKHGDSDYGEIEMWYKDILDGVNIKGK